MPYYWQREFYLFFLKDECVYLTRTKDFVSFSEARMVIERGGDEDQEWHVGTGSVCRMGEKFYFYYTGFRNPNTISSERHEQVIMRAISEDLLNCLIRNIVRMVIGEIRTCPGMKRWANTLCWLRPQKKKARIIEEAAR